MKLTRLLSSPTALLTVAASVGIATIVSSAAPASAISNPVTLKFVCASGQAASTAALCPIGASQFSAVVSPVGTNQVNFSFRNIGAAASAIFKIDIFDKAQYSLGNRVSVIGTPALVPGSVLNFTSTTSVSGPIHRFISTAVGANGVQRNNSINPGERLDILFNIANAGFNKPFNAVIADLTHSNLAVQLTATGIGNVENQRSTQVIYNSKVQAVPEPLTLLGSGAALGFGALMKRRSSKLKAKKAGNTPVEPALEAVA